MENYKPTKTEKIRARAEVFMAIRNGNMIKIPCIDCGNKKSEAHHEDYSKPLDVLWLCKEHHWDRHRVNPKRQPKTKNNFIRFIPIERIKKVVRNYDINCMFCNKIIPVHNTKYCNENCFEQMAVKMNWVKWWLK